MRVKVNRRKLDVLRVVLLALDERPEPESFTALVNRAYDYGRRYEPSITRGEIRGAWNKALRDVDDNQEKLGRST